VLLGLQTNLPLTLLLLALAAGCRQDAKPQAEGAAAHAGETRPPRDVRLAKVTQTTFEKVIEIAGTLAADEQVVLATKVAGRLASIDVDLASPVKQGQKIAQLETTDYELGVQQARAALWQVRAQLGLSATGSGQVRIDETAVVRQALATLEEARASASRMEKLAGEGLAPQAELETARAALLRAEASLESAREEVRLRQAQKRQRESELEIARQRLADTVIVSPLDGYVQARRASRGEYLAAGAPVAEVVRVNPLRLRVSVPEREAVELKVGQPVLVRVGGQSGSSEAGTEHRGVVARLAPSLDAQSRSLLIEADIQNDGALRPGNFVQSRIVLGQRSVLAVPKTAIVTFAGLQKVILVENGKAVERPVTTGDTRGDEIEIVTGLRAGEAVVDDPGTLQQGQPVHVGAEGGER
jgi:HlyD family secretion protein